MEVGSVVTVTDGVVEAVGCIVEKFSASTHTYLDAVVEWTGVPKGIEWLLNEPSMVEGHVQGGTVYTIMALTEGV